MRFSQIAGSALGSGRRLGLLGGEPLDYLPLTQTVRGPAQLIVERRELHVSVEPVRVGLDDFLKIRGGGFGVTFGALEQSQFVSCECGSRAEPERALDVDPGLIQIAASK